MHNHRMRALADAVLVGAATLRCDDPQLTVRGCSGRNPVRVVLDTNLTLDDTYRVFRDATAPTLVLAAVLTSQMAGAWLDYVLRRGWPLLTPVNGGELAMVPEPEIPSAA